MGSRLGRLLSAACFAAVLPVTAVALAQGNLVSNPSFELVPCATPCSPGQGALPSGWIGLSLSPDTYSNDGSYGLGPGEFGHFPGVTAPDGIRWMAGGSFPEILGQTGVALTPGVEYAISAFLHEDNGAGGFALPNPGSYRVELWDGTTTAADKLVLGTFALTADPTSWEFRTFNVVAPAGASTHTVLALVPVGSPQGAAYPGIDNVVIQPAAMAPAPGLPVVRLVSGGVGGAPPDGASVNPSVSADGRLVVFQSIARNLVASGCTDGGSHVFLRDRAAQTTICLSVSPRGAPGNGPSSRPAISADGRVVAFVSSARNLVAVGCRAGIAYVFVRDLATGITTCVAVATGGVPADGPSDAPTLSGDGRLVAFASGATNLGGCPGVIVQLFLHDRTTGATTCVTVGVNGLQGDAPSGEPALSADGQVLAFESLATNLVAQGCVVGAVVQVFVRRLGPGGATTCASVAADGAPGNASSGGPALSASGSVLVFVSAAGNLAAPCGPGIPQVYVRRLLLLVTECISVGPGGVPGNGPSADPAISANGGTVVFTGQATNLASGALGAGPGGGRQLPPGAATTFRWRDTDAVQDPITALLTGTASGTGQKANALSGDGAVTVTEAQLTAAGPAIAAIEEVAPPPAGQSLIVAPAPGTAFTLLGAIPLTFEWTAVRSLIRPRRLSF
jgi:TolB protein